MLTSTHVGEYKICLLFDFHVTTSAGGHLLSSWNRNLGRSPTRITRQETSNVASSPFLYATDRHFLCNHNVLHWYCRICNVPISIFAILQYFIYCVIAAGPSSKSLLADKSPQAWVHLKAAQLQPSAALASIFSVQRQKVRLKTRSKLLSWKIFNWKSK